MNGDRSLMTRRPSRSTGDNTVVLVRVPVLSDLYFQISLCEFDIAVDVRAQPTFLSTTWGSGRKGLNRKIEESFLMKFPGLEFSSEASNGRCFVSLSLYTTNQYLFIHDSRRASKQTTLPHPNKL